MVKKPQQNEYDSVYFLKILLYLILGTLWVAPNGDRTVPLGLVLGIIAVQHERLQIDRKIEYAMLLIGTVLGITGLGLTVNL